MQNTARSRQEKQRRDERQRKRNRKCDKNHKSNETVKAHFLCVGCESNIHCENCNKEDVVRTGHIREDGNYDCYKFNPEMYCPSN